MEDISPAIDTNPINASPSQLCRGGVQCINALPRIDNQVYGGYINKKRYNLGETYCCDECEFACAHKKPLPLKADGHLTKAFRSKEDRFKVWIDVTELGISEKVTALCVKVEEIVEKIIDKGRRERPSLQLLLCWPVEDEVGVYELKLVVGPSAMKYNGNYAKYLGFMGQVTTLYPNMRKGNERASDVEGGGEIR